MPFRASKKIRERWVDHLDPQFNRKSPTKEEKQAIRTYLHKMVPKNINSKNGHIQWSVISNEYNKDRKSGEFRSDSFLKNIYNNSIYPKSKKRKATPSSPQTQISLQKREFQLLPPMNLRATDLRDFLVAPSEKKKNETIEKKLPPTLIPEPIFSCSQTPISLQNIVSPLLPPMDLPATSPKFVLVATPETRKSEPPIEKKSSLDSPPEFIPFSEFLELPALSLTPEVDHILPELYPSSFNPLMG